MPVTPENLMLLASLFSVSFLRVMPSSVTVISPETEATVTTPPFSWLTLKLLAVPFITTLP